MNSNTGNEQHSCFINVPANWAYTVCDSCNPSTTLSIGTSVVNTVSKLDTSCTASSRACERPKLVKRRQRMAGLDTLGLNGGWIFFWMNF